MRTKRAWLALALGVEATLAVVDAAVGGGVTLTALLVLGPLLAAARLGPGETGLAGVGAVALAAASAAWNGHVSTGTYAVSVAVVASGSALAVWIASLTEGMRRSRDQLVAILEGVADGVTAQDPSGRLVFANAAAVEATGYDTAAEMRAARPEQRLAGFEIQDEEGNPMDPERLPSRRALRGEDPPPATVSFRPTGDRGEHRWSVIKSSPVRDKDGNVVLAISVTEDVTAHKRDQQRQRFLAEAGELLSSSLDYDTTLRRLAELAVPDLADWCAVDVVDEGGRIRHVALAHTDRTRLGIAQDLRRRYPPDPDDEGGVPAVLRSGKPELFPEITDEMIDEGARDDEHAALIRALDMSSAIVVPMIARGRTLGAITFVGGTLRPSFGADDRQLAMELARRAAIAVDNARLYTERSRIARALQESLLPPSLPTISGVELAARFRPAGEGIDIGGDFYDVFPGAGDTWMIAVGDVSGKGAEAAAITALARYTLRAAAMTDQQPSAMLGTLNRAMARQRRGEDFCTVVCGMLAPHSGGPARLTVASGGHPLPILLRRDGSAESIGANGTLLGVVPDPDIPDTAIDLEPGDALILYTDGLTEAQAPNVIIEEQGLLDLAAPCVGMPAAAIAEHLERAAVAGDSPIRDDIAIVVVRIRE